MGDCLPVARDRAVDKLSFDLFFRYKKRNKGCVITDRNQYYTHCVQVPELRWNDMVMG